MMNAKSSVRRTLFDIRKNPLNALSCNLIDTYKDINVKYYSKKRKAEEELEPRRTKIHAPEQVCWDDCNNDYIIRPGDIIKGRYQLVEKMGKGSFGQVARAYDRLTSTFVAVKIIKNKTAYQQLARWEIKYLQLICQNARTADCFATIKDSFLFRNHVVIVFELLHENLFDHLKALDFTGLDLNTVKSIAFQTLQGLQALSTMQPPLVHGDLKPENMMFATGNRDKVKIIDAGSMSVEGKPMFTYIQSRFYRAPEVLIGVKFDSKIDVWSLGCILVELYTGMPIFDGLDESDQMHKIIEVLGLPPKYMLKNGTKRAQVIPRNASREYKNPGTRSLAKVLRRPKKSIFVDCAGDYEQLLNLVQKMLIIDPVHRISASEALEHPFFCSKLALSMESDSVFNACATLSSLSSLSSFTSSSLNMEPTSPCSSESYAVALYARSMTEPHSRRIRAL